MKKVLKRKIMGIWNWRRDGNVRLFVMDTLMGRKFKWEDIHGGSSEYVRENICRGRNLWRNGGL
jgi:hypothetical protein